MPPTYHTVFAFGMVMVVVWLGLCAFLFSYLEKKHPQAFEALGKPHLWRNNQPMHSLRLLVFLFTRGSGTGDRFLSGFIWLMRAHLIACLAIMVTLFSIGLPPRVKRDGDIAECHPQR